MNRVTIAVDLAKHVFEIAITKGDGRIQERHRLRRLQFERFWQQRARCLVVMEACASSHYWARHLRERGYQVKLLPARYVRAYRRRSKTDAADCEALLEAARCGSIHPVSVKSESQQAVLALHRLRSQWVSARTARINGLRALLHEFGVQTASGRSRLLQGMSALLDAHGAMLPGHVRLCAAAMWEEIREIDGRVKLLDLELTEVASAEPVVQQLMTIPGIGPLTATALFASVGNIHAFGSGRQLSCWLGLTPREFSSGSTRRVGRISKQGDAYLRTLLIHGARAALLAARRAERSGKRLTRIQSWALERTTLKHPNQAAVALANKMARVAWAVWYHGRPFNGDHVSRAA